MAVLIEGISVVVIRKAIESRCRGGWEGFVSLVPNRTLCTDGELARVGFMSPDATREFIADLEDAGLVFEASNRPMDMTVIDQQQGPLFQPTGSNLPT
jgi:hypothetical protein